MITNTQHRGFTLIEILIVIAIIGMVVGAAVLSLTSQQHRNIAQLAEQLTSQLQLASQEAMLKFTQYGFSTTSKQSYQFYVLDEDENPPRWKIIENRAAFRAAIIPKNYTLEIERTDESLESLPVSNPPDIEFHANGDITPFALEIFDDEKKLLHEIVGDRAGNIRLDPSP